MSPVDVPENAHIIYVFVPYSPIITLAFVTISAVLIFRIVLRLIDIANPVT